MKLTRILCFLLAFLIVPIAITPNAAALTWTRGEAFDHKGTDNSAPGTNGKVQIESLGSQTHMFTQTSEPDDELIHLNSVNGSPFAPHLVSSLPGSDAAFDFKLIDENTIVGCVTQGGTIDFVGSTTAGAGWFTTSGIAAPGAGNADDCAIIAWNSTTYSIVYDVDSTTDVVSRRTTDSGLTWSTVNIDTTQEFGLVVQGANQNNTHGVVMFDQITTDDVTVCRTTTGGLTWTSCVDVGSQDVADDGQLELRHVSGNRYDFAHGNSAESVSYCTNNSQFAGPTTCFTVAVSQTGLSAVTFTLDPLDTTHIGVVWAKGTSTTPLRFSQSSDFGATWTADESLHTFVASVDFDYIGVTVSEDWGIIATSRECYNGASWTGVNTVDCGGALTDGTGTAVYYSPFSASEVIEAEATASVTDLVGFDVDPTGSIAIARTSLGENVLTFNAQTLGTSVSGTIDTNCAVGTNDYEDGVMARSLDSGGDAQLVGFLNCDAGGDAQYLSIRQVDGSIPTLDQFNDCEPVDAGGVGCHYNIDLTDFDEPIDSGLGQLGQVKDFPIDYSNQGSFLGSIVGRTAWAFASQQCDDPPGPTYCTGTEPGYVSVATYTARAVDPANTDSVQHHPDQDVHDFCLGLDGSNYYLASVVTGQPGHTWSVTFSETDGDALDSSISNSPSSFGSSAYAVGCGGGQIVFVNGDNSLQLLSRTGTFIDSIAGVDAETRGVSLSEEFVGPAGAVADRGTSCTTALEDTGDCLQFGVYVDGLEGVIVNVTGGSLVEVGRLTLPSGSFHSIRMDRLAQNIWVATSTTIARFEVFTVTTEDPVNIPGDEDDGDALPGDGLFEGSGATVGAAFGVGAFGGNLFLGAVLMGIVAYGVGIGYGNTMDSQSMQPRALRVNPWAAAVGAAMGFLLAWGFGFFSTAVVFSLIALVAMIVGIRLWVSRG